MLSFTSQPRISRTRVRGSPWRGKCGLTAGNCRQCLLSWARPFSTQHARKRNEKMINASLCKHDDSGKAQHRKQRQADQGKVSHQLRKMLHAQASISLEDGRVQGLTGSGNRRVTTGDRPCSRPGTSGRPFPWALAHSLPTGPRHPPSSPAPGLPALVT